MNEYEKRAAAVLRHLHVPGAPLLGQGGEGRIYALGVDEVVKVYTAGASAPYLAALAALLTRIAAVELPFTTPRILEIGELAGTCYTRERRLPGRHWEEVAGHLAPADMRRLLDPYLDALRALGAIALYDLPYGQVLRLPDRLTAASWPEFLLASVERVVGRAAPDLQGDVVDFHGRLDTFRELVACYVPELPPRRLVHGDYFPGNLLIGDLQEVWALLDFSPHTVAGDPVLDVAGAAAFLDAMPGTRPEDTAYLRERALAAYGADIAPLLDLYTLYYGFYFSDTKGADPATYAWCVRHLDDAGLWARLRE